MFREDSFLVSIIIPCRNEKAFIGSCLDSVLANDFPKDQLEVLVIDGMSEDGTRGILNDYAQSHSVISMLDNLKRVTPAALNIGIKRARGTIVMRMDAHTRYDQKYVSRCVDALLTYKADNVGGIWKTLPRSETLTGWCIVKALSHPFGVGNSHFRLARLREPKWVDTVPFFCVKRELFLKSGWFNEHHGCDDMRLGIRMNQLGAFNEKLTRGQDMDFSLRLMKAGGRTILVPDIVSYYYARSDIRSFWSHNWNNGVWAILPFAYSRIIPVRWRHLVPLMFVGSLAVSIALMSWNKSFAWLLLTIIGVYVVANVLASAHVAWKERKLRYVLMMPLVFSMLHLGYGLGSLWGVARLLSTREFWRKAFRLELEEPGRTA